MVAPIGMVESKLLQSLATLCVDIGQSEAMIVEWINCGSTTS